MIIIGIDMSKNSPGVCINKDGNLEFKSFIRGQNTGKIKIHYDSLIESGVSMHFYDQVQPSGLEYTDLEVWKANDAMMYAKHIVSQLPDNADIVGIEGFSYGSSGNSFIDIVGYGYAIRLAIIEKYGKDKLAVFSPGNVKKTAGKGNANKEKIMEFFMETTSKDLHNNLLWQNLQNKSVDKTKKPIDDLTDSFYVQECTRNFLQNKLKK